MGNIFRNEQAKLVKFEELIKDTNLSRDDIAAAIHEFKKDFQDLLDQVIMLTKVSDRLQNKLDKTNDKLNLTNDELKKTIDELTLTKINKKAKVVAYIAVVTLFLFSEVVIEPSIDFVAQSIYIGLIFKTIIAILIKPIEDLFEHFMLKRAGFQFTKNH
ncbi:MAG: hypothetical protein NT007_02480 [Candidatus Kapabacteria bacterium]|nr:hypothetical protein [Candidatus Kapabacteria bacterium]